MHKNIPIVVGITILFLGLAINPAIAVNPISSDNEDDCNICPKVSNLQVVEKYRELSDRINTLPEIEDKDLSANPWRFPIFNAFCNIVKYLNDSYFSIYEFLESHLSSGIFIIGLIYSFLIELILLPMFIILYPLLLICDLY